MVYVPEKELPLRPKTAAAAIRRAVGVAAKYLGTDGTLAALAVADLLDPPPTPPAKPADPAGNFLTRAAEASSSPDVKGRLHKAYLEASAAVLNSPPLVLPTGLKVTSPTPATAERDYVLVGGPHSGTKERLRGDPPRRIPLPGSGGHYEYRPFALCEGGWYDYVGPEKPASSPSPPPPQPCTRDVTFWGGPLGGKKLPFGTDNLKPGFRHRVTEGGREHSYVYSEPMNGVHSYVYSEPMNGVGDGWFSYEGVTAVTG